MMRVSLSNLRLVLQAHKWPGRKAGVVGTALGGQLVEVRRGK